MNKQKRFGSQILILILSLMIIFSMSGFSFAAEDGTTSSAFTSISDTRWSMTEQEDVEVAFNLGAGTTKDDLVWTFNGQSFEEWSAEFADWKEGTDLTTEVLGVKDVNVAENGDVTATLHVDYLFDGCDAAYWRPWYAYTGNYDLKVENKSTGTSAVQTIRYEVSDLYMPYDELDSTIEDIIKNKTNDIYMSWESTGKSEDGLDIMDCIIAKDKAAVDKYLALKERAEAEPDAVLADLESGKLTDFQVPVYITNIHANETPGVDAQVEFIREIANNETIEYTTEEYKNDKFVRFDKEKTRVTKEFNVKDILDNVILIVRPTENPYALKEIQRGNVNGFDLNRDSTYQTQIESQVATADIVKWDPVTLVELHGWLYSARTQLSIEPCTPPHEPNLEYDLFMNYALEGARAFGDSACLNTKYVLNEDYLNNEDFKEDNKFYTDNGMELGDPWYEINIVDGLKDGVWVEPSDDMSSNYTPTYALFHGTIGYTIECGELNDESTMAHVYGVIGHTQYVAEHKTELYKNQLEFFKRANANEESEETEKWFVDQNNQPVKDFREKNEKGKFYPEYYVIPTDVSQRDLADAYEMQNFFLRNGVKIQQLKENVTVGGQTFKKGAFVIDMHQAKRSMANVVLYKGVKVLDWTGLFSESITNFPDLRGFNSYAVSESGVFDGKTAEITEPVDAKSITTGTGKKVLIIKNDGIDSVNAVNQLLYDGVKVGYITKGGDNYAIGDFAISYADRSKIDSCYTLRLVKSATIPEAKNIKKPKLCLEGSSFDIFAFTKQMKFKTYDADKANVVFSSEEPSEEAKAVIDKGVPFIGASCYVLDYAKAKLPGFDYTAECQVDYWGDTEFNDSEALFKVNFAKSNLITGNYRASGDDMIYTKGGSFISSVPEGATKIITAKKSDYYVSGWWNDIDKLAGQTVAIDYNKNGLNMTIFANSITNKAHQTDDYRLAANAIYSKLLGTEFMAKEKAEIAKAAKIKAAKAMTVKGFTVTPKAKKAIVTYKKTKGATGYQVQYKLKTSKTWKNVTKFTKKLKVTKTKLKSGKKYSFRVRTVTKIDGKKYNGKWTKVKTVKIK